MAQSIGHARWGRAAASDSDHTEDGGLLVSPWLYFLGIGLWAFVFAAGWALSRAPL